MNKNFNDSDSTITLEEELNEEYEPTDQEIREYALHLGMRLPQDAQFIDIARAGLKARLPAEWKPYQRTVQGEQEVYYKNTLTGEIIYDHPVDLIYKQKYQEAKQLDSKKPTKKSSGINKFKQNIQQYRQEDDDPKKLLEGPDDQSFMIESNFHQPSYQVQNPSLLLQNSATQNMQSAVDFEFTNKVNKYDEDKKEELLKYKEDAKQKLNKMELMLMNEADPDLFDMKEEYSRRVEQQRKELEDKKTKVKRKVEEEFNDKLNKQRNLIAKGQERSIEDLEFDQEKELKIKLRQIEQELVQGHKEVIARINKKQREIADMDSKAGKEVQEKRRQLQQQLDKSKQQIKQEIHKQSVDFDQELQKKSKQQREQYSKQVQAQAQQKMKELKFEIIDYQEQYDKQVRSIREQIKSAYDPTFEDLQQQNVSTLQDFEDQEKAQLQQSVQTYKQQQQTNRKQLIQQQTTAKIDNLAQQTSAKITALERSAQDNLEAQKKHLEDQKRAKLQQIQKDLERKTGKSMNGNEVELMMEINSLKAQIQECEDQIKLFRRQRSELKQREQALNEVITKYDLHKVLQQQEVVKYDLDNKSFFVEQLQQQHSQVQMELNQAEQQQQIQLKKLQESQIRQSQLQVLIQEVSQLKELITPLTKSQLEQRPQQSQLQSQYQKSSVPFVQKQQISELNQSMNVSMMLEDQQTTIRRWKSVLVDERVQLNRAMKNIKSAKEDLKVIQRKLMNDQENLKAQIRISKSTGNSSLSKDILKKLKSEVQANLQKLTDDITKLNDRRTTNRQRQQALNQLETAFNDNQNQGQWLASMDNLYQMYQRIGDTVSVDDDFNVEIQEEDESYLRKESQVDIPKSQSQPMVTSQDQPYQTPLVTLNPQSYNDNKLAKENKSICERQARIDLVGHKDWLQNCKYKMISTNSSNNDYRNTMMRYQSFMQMQV